MVSASFVPNLAPSSFLAQLQRKVALIRWTNTAYAAHIHSSALCDVPWRIEKGAAHSENFLGGLVCTGNLAFRLQ